MYQLATVYEMYLDLQAYLHVQWLRFQHVNIVCDIGSFLLVGPMAVYRPL